MSNEVATKVKRVVDRDKANERNRRYYERNKEKLAVKWQANKEKHSTRARATYLKNREKLLAKQRVYYQENKASVLRYQSDYYKENKEKCLAASVGWLRRKMEADPEFAAQRRARAVEYNREKMASDPVYRERANKTNCASKARRRKTDIGFRLLVNLRRRLHKAVTKQAGYKVDRTIILLGCTALQLRQHLESQWEAWMTWESYGQGEGFWVVDHIVPCARFDLSTEAGQRECFHFSNLRPLCWRENMEKSDS